jgi:mono/diheme cytochrome c family protein
MPSASFAAMTDKDLSAILAYIRSAPQQSTRHPETEHGLLTRYRMVTGDFPAQAVSGFHQPWRETFRGNEMRLGEYLATVTCSQCHGADLNGAKNAPSLRTINDYDRFEFVALMQNGTGPGEVPIEAKQGMAGKRFALLTEAEIEALYLYLKTRP